MSVGSEMCENPASDSTHHQKHFFQLCSTDYDLCSAATSILGVSSFYMHILMFIYNENIYDTEKCRESGKVENRVGAMNSDLSCT